MIIAAPVAERPFQVVFDLLWNRTGFAWFNFGSINNIPAITGFKKTSVTNRPCGVVDHIQPIKSDAFYTPVHVLVRRERHDECFRRAEEVKLVRE